MLMRRRMTMMVRRRICVSPLGMLLFTNCSRNFTSPVFFVCHKKHAYQETENYTRLREPGPERRNDFLENTQQICDKERPTAQNNQAALYLFSIDISQLEKNIYIFLSWNSIDISWVGKQIFLSYLIPIYCLRCGLNYRNRQTLSFFRNLLQ